MFSIPLHFDRVKVSCYYAIYCDKMDASRGIFSKSSTSYIAFRYPRRDNKGIAVFILKRVSALERMGFLKLIINSYILLGKQFLEFETWKKVQYIHLSCAEKFNINSLADDIHYSCRPRHKTRDGCKYYFMH